MSKKCHKRHHLFLNWLRANRARFPLPPRVLGIRRDSIELGFGGIPSRWKFSVEYTASGGPYISADWEASSGEREGVMRIYGAEVETSDGWTSLLLPAGDARHWATRQDLWTVLCYETFLEWCNSELVGGADHA